MNTPVPATPAPSTTAITPPPPPPPQPTPYVNPVTPIPVGGPFSAVEDDVIYVSYSEEVRAFTVDAATGRLNQIDSIKTSSHGKLLVLNGGQTLLLARLDKNVITLYAVALNADGKFASTPTEVFTSSGFDVQVSEEHSLLFKMDKLPAKPPQEPCCYAGTFTPQVTPYKISGKNGSLAFTQSAPAWELLDPRDYIGSDYRWFASMKFDSVQSYNGKPSLWLRRHVSAGSPSPDSIHSRVVFDQSSGAFIEHVRELRNVLAFAQQKDALLAHHAFSDDGYEYGWLIFHPDATDQAVNWTCTSFRYESYRSFQPVEYILAACNGAGFFIDTGSPRFYLFQNSAYWSYRFDPKGLDVSSETRSPVELTPERTTFLPKSSTAIGFTSPYNDTMFSLKVDRETGAVSIGTPPFDARGIVHWVVR